MPDYLEKPNPVPYDLHLTSGGAQVVDQFPAAPHSDVYYTPPMYERGSPAWNLLSRAEQEGQIDRRIGLLRDLNRVANKISITDALTGLENRRGLITDLKKEIAAEKSGSIARSVLLFVDIDRFKRVNDSMGHMVGDQILHDIGERFQAIPIRQGEVIARFGGDEFVMLAHIERQAGNGKRGRRPEDDNLELLSARLAREVEESGKALGVDYITASVGRPIKHLPDETAEDWLARADTAMYKQKHAGTVL